MAADSGTPLEVPVVLAGSAPLPAYETADSAGMDLRANLETAIQLGPGARALVPTGLWLQIPSGFEAQVRPRSGLALKRGLTVLNAPGTIDADYRGQVQVILVNLSSQDQTIEPGDRIAQLVFAPVTRACLRVVTKLEGSGRGAGGFGSTGVR